MKVTLKKTHTHAGRALEPGAVIDVDESTAKWLAEHEVIAPLPGMAAPSTTSTAPASTMSSAAKE